MTSMRIRFQGTLQPPSHTLEDMVRGCVIRSPDVKRDHLVGRLGGWKGADGLTRFAARWAWQSLSQPAKKGQDARNSDFLHRNVSLAVCCASAATFFSDFLHNNKFLQNPLKKFLHPGKFLHAPSPTGCSQPACRAAPSSTPRHGLSTST